MRTAIAIVAIAIMAVSCAPKVISINDTGGVVKNVRDTNFRRSLKTADDWCRARGMVAQLQGRDNLRSQLVFACVKAPAS